MSTTYVRFVDERDDELGRVLEGIRDALIRHPIATQSAFSALVAEGRRFSETAEGKTMCAQLADSELLARLRVVWESLSMTAFSERPDAPLPSFFLEGVVRAAVERGLESLLSRAFDDEP
jgi:hypothetical protein